MVKNTIKNRRIQELVLKYITVTKKLKKELNFSGGDIKEHYGIFLARQYIPKLERNKHSNIKGYDAKDKFNKKIEFKTGTTGKDGEHRNVFKSWRKKKEFNYAQKGGEICLRRFQKKGRSIF